MTYRLRNIAVAVGLALVAALLTTFYVANYKRHVRQSESTVKVYVAKRDVPQGTSGAEMIKRHLMVTSDVTARTVVPGYVSSPDQVASLLTTQTIFAGEQVTLRRFASHAQQGIRSQLHGTLRALSLPGTNDQLLAGILKDGDHVDVMANLKTGGCAATPASLSASSHGTCSCCTRPAPGPIPRRSAPATRRWCSPSATAARVRRSSTPCRTPPAGRSSCAPSPTRPTRRTTSESNVSMLHDNITPANLSHFLGSGR